jgi:hypothetical protein
MRAGPHGLRAIVNYIEIGRWPSKLRSVRFHSKVEAKPFWTRPATFDPGLWQLQQVVLFRGTTLLFK